MSGTPPTSRARPETGAEVGVVTLVVAHYRDPLGLDRVLTALEASTHPLDRLHVVIADDGSPEPPQPGPRPFDVQVVRQDDRGFRAAAVRNLGARAARGDVICFLDGDTVPEPDYVTRLAASCRAGARDDVRGRCLAVGRRRHGDFTGLDAAATAAFVAGGPDRDEDRVLAEPQWLADGYAATQNLRAADDRSYRFVISAVLAVSAPLWQTVGGFDESFVGYGGEDWELAYRSRLAGARFVHEPAAVAWHDGGDITDRDRASGRSERAVIEAKNVEARRLAELITEPGARDPGLIWRVPDAVVRLKGTQWSAAEVLLTCADLVRDSDAQVWAGDADLSAWPSSDPRVHPGQPPADVAARCRHHVNVDRPLTLTLPLAQLCERGSATYPGLTVRHARDIALGRRPAVGAAGLVLSPESDGDRLDAEWGWRREGRRAAPAAAGVALESDPSDLSGRAGGPGAPAESGETP